MGRGIEKTEIFRNQEDREDFLSRIEHLCSSKKKRRDGDRLIIHNIQEPITPSLAWGKIDYDPRPADDSIFFFL